MRCRIEFGLLVLTAFSASLLQAIPPQKPAPETKSLIGQDLILVGYGTEAGVTYTNASALGKPGNSCDTPVEVRKAVYSRNQLRIDVEQIGSLQLLGNATAGLIAPCRGNSGTTKLLIRNVNLDSVAATLQLVSENVLMTPDSYLASRGIPFDFPPAAGNETPVSAAVVLPPVPNKLLVVTPSYSDKARKARLQGTISIAFVAGSDGRVQSPRIVKGLGSGLDEQSLRVLPLWRFEPAQLNGRAVAVRATTTFTFNLY